MECVYSGNVIVDKLETLDSGNFAPGLAVGGSPPR